MVVDQDDPLAGELEGGLQGLAGALEGILAVGILEAQGLTGSSTLPGL